MQKHDHQSRDDDRQGDQMMGGTAAGHPQQRDEAGAKEDVINERSGRASPLEMGAAGSRTGEEMTAPMMLQHMAETAE